MKRVKPLQILHSPGISGLLPEQADRLAGLARQVVSAHPVCGPVQLILADDAHLRRLNAAYRGQDRPTDVLSFDLGPAAVSGQEASSGEIYISMERAEAQATEQDLPLLAEIARLLTHGLLHLAGFDHDTPESLRFMEDETDRFLQQTGFLASSEPGPPPTAPAGSSARKERPLPWNPR
jgi:probable rRNA maturation factor